MKSNETKQSQKNYSLTWFVRRRWNILDLIQVVEQGAVPTYLFAEIDMTWAENMRYDLAQQGIRVTVTALLLKAIGIAQRSHPCSRAALLPWGQTMVINKIVAGFTVEKVVDDEPAVYLGIIKDPDTKSLAEISAELQTYSEGDINDVPQLAMEERFNHMPWLVRRFILLLGLTIPWIRFRYLPASFGLTSIGKYGIQGVVPPCVNASTFGVGVVEPKPVVHNGQIEIRPMMNLILNFDHRVIDGAPASRFLSDVQKLMEGGLAEYVHEGNEAVQASNTSRNCVSAAGEKAYS
jgi:pyruvate/2-oxoglutarate dehydrogenase complex dihydrolipoamide acyltransferase (E2) component